MGVNKSMRVVLASKSPRRKEILENLGLKFDVIVADAEESCDIADGCLIIASDTLVFAEGEFLGKPKDRSDAKRMIEMLSGKAHSVVSGLYLSYGGKEYSDAGETKVIFDEMTESEIDDYISSPEPYDKAGGYAVQGLASLYVSGIEGDYFNVVGLPVNLLYKALKQEFGIDINSLKA